MSSTNAIFTGNSRYSSDFQTVIDRAVAIASLPLSQLTIEKSKLTDESTALNAINSKFASLQSAAQAIGTSLGSNSFEASVSDHSIVSATVGAGALEGTYSIEVTSMGAYTTTITSDSGPLKVTDPAAQNISLASSFTLSVGASTYTIKPETKSLNSLAAAINSTTGANVRATVVNVGSSVAPDYRLSLQSTKLANIAIQLSDGTNLQTEQVRGSNATYKVNGATQQATSDSRSVTIAPGLSVDLLAESDPGVATNITVSRSFSGASVTLASFANAYNAAVDELDKHRGESDGALRGQSIVYDLSESLRDITSYISSAAGVNSIASIGLEFDKKGKLSFDSAAFSDASASDSKGVLAFLGSSTESGFLKATGDALESTNDPLSGSIELAIGSVQSQITSQDQLISVNQSRVDDLRQQLQEQMAASDALIATMEQQYNYLNGMFQSMLAAAQSYK